MKKVFKYNSKESGYILTKGKNYEIHLNIKSNIYGQFHHIVNDLGVLHYITNRDLEKLFLDLEQIRQNKLEQLLNTK